jgi:addiction module HigA family antidote
MTEICMSELIRRNALSRTDLSDVATGERLPNVPPGEVLKAEFMEPMKLSARALAADIDVPANRITEILNGTRAITPDTAVRLGLRLGTSADFWMKLQVLHDLDVWRKRRKESIKQQLRLLRSGKMRTGENRGLGQRDTTGADIERLEGWLAELDALA